MKLKPIWLSMFWVLLLLAGFTPSQADEQTTLSPFHPEHISTYSLSPDQNLWFLSGKKIMQTQYVDGEWRPKAVFGVTPYVSRLAASSNYVWTIDAQKILAYQRSEHDLQLFSETARPSTYFTWIDFAAALDSEGITLAQGETLYTAELVAGEIQLQQLENTGCFRVTALTRTKDWLLFSCAESQTYIYQNTGSGYQLKQKLDGGLLFFHQQANSVSVYKQQERQIQTYALADLSLLNTIDGVMARYQNSNTALVLAQKAVANSETGYLAFLRLNAAGEVIDERRIGDSFFYDLTSLPNLQSFLYDAGDKIFRNFEYWQKDPNDGRYYYKGDDWQYKLGLSLSDYQSFPEANGFATGRNGKQIWFAEQGQMPKLQGYVHLATPTYQYVHINQVAQHQQNWWVAGLDQNTQRLYLKLWTPDQTFEQIEIPATQGEGAIEPLFYNDTNDSLLVARIKGIIVSCQSASALRTPSQCQSFEMPSQRQTPVFTRQGVLLFHVQSGDNVDAEMYELTSSGLQLRWKTKVSYDFMSQTKVYIKDSGVLLGVNNHLILEGPAQGTFSPSSNSELTSNCYPRTEQDVLCTTALTLFRYSSDYKQVIRFNFANESSPFYSSHHFHSDLTGQVLLMTIGDTQLTTDAMITRHQLAFPLLQFTGRELPVSVLQGESLVVDATQILTPLSGLSVTAWGWSEEFGLPIQRLWQELGNNRWQLNTQNEVARYNATVGIGFGVTEDDWQASAGKSLRVLNLNDAPSLRMENYINDLTVGSSWLLVFDEAIEDIDGDSLTYTTQNLPEGFVQQAKGVLATPKAAGQYQFTVTATDPSGASVTATFSGTVRDRPVVNLPNPPAESSSGSGGSVGCWSLLALLMLALRRQSGQSRYLAPVWV